MASHVCNHRSKRVPLPPLRWPWSLSREHVRAAKGQAFWAGSVTLIIVLWSTLSETPDCTLLPARRTPSVCGYSEASLLASVQQDHGFSRLSPRYYYEQEWIDYQILFKKLNVMRQLSRAKVW